MSDSKVSVAIIGAGIIGVTAAAYLLRDGYEVTFFDHQGLGESTSSGNAGAFAYADIYPLNKPSLLLKAPRWFIDPLGPLAIPTAYIPKILPWLVRFAWACRPAQVRRSVETMKQIMALSREQAHRFWPQWELEDQVINRGVLNLYEKPKNFQADQAQWQECAEHGIEVQVLEGGEIQAVEPGLQRCFSHAVRITDWPTVADPKVYTKTIGEKVLQQGASLIESRVAGLNINQDGAIKVITEEGVAMVFDKLVIAAGAWSGQLTKMLGDTIPLDTERGYNTTLPEPGVNISHMLVFPEHAFVITPMTCGLRIGGANELAGTDSPPNYKRADYLLDKARTFLSGLTDKGGKQWMGCRPSLPDAQPVIDYSSASENVVYAFGHGHYGLTQSAATAKLVLELLNHQSPSMDMDGLRADRF